MIGPKISKIIDDLATRLRHIATLRQEIADTQLHLSLLQDALDVTEDDVEVLQRDLLLIIDQQSATTHPVTDGLSEHIGGLCRHQ